MEGRLLLTEDRVRHRTRATAGRAGDAEPEQLKPHPRDLPHHLRHRRPTTHVRGNARPRREGPVRLPDHGPEGPRQAHPPRPPIRVNLLYFLKGAPLARRAAMPPRPGCGLRPVPSGRHRPTPDASLTARSSPAATTSRGVTRPSSAAPRHGRRNGRVHTSRFRPPSARDTTATANGPSASQRSHRRLAHRGPSQTSDQHAQGRTTNRPAHAAQNSADYARHVSA